MSKPWSFILFCCVLFSSLLHSQVIIKPYAGFLFGEMNDANEVVSISLSQASRLLGEEIIAPEKFDGGQILGFQLEYNTNSDLFVNINVGFHTQDIAFSQSSQLNPGLWEYRFEREVSLYDVTVNLDYYFNYSSWRRFNYFIGLGAGWMQLQAESLTRSNAPNLALDSQGEYTRSIFSGTLSGGGRLRITELLYLWGEGGIQYGNFGKLEGTVTTIDNPQPVADETETNFDLTGLFVRGGLGIALPFLR